MEATRDATQNEQYRASVAANATKAHWSRAGIYVVIALSFFLLGSVPMWLKARTYESQRDAAQHELRLSRMENTLSFAVIEARRGMFEPARQTTSDFFTTLRSQIDAGNNSALSPAQRDRLKSLLSGRDSVITLLARSDSAAADRLSDMYVTYRSAMSNVQPRGGS